MKKTTPTATFTIAKFCQLAGFDRHTLAKRLSEAGATPVAQSAQGASCFSLRDLIQGVLGGDIEAARVRLVTAQADRAEHALAVSRRDYVPTAEIIKLNEGIAVAIREIIWRSPLDEGARRAILHELCSLKDHDWRGAGL
jgi:phage terminase Nu1 subunit (DNA packaging protein)